MDLPVELIVMIFTMLPEWYFPLISLTCRRFLQLVPKQQNSYILTESAAKDGHLNILKWAIDNGFPWSDNVCTYAADGGHLEILKWAIEHDYPYYEDSCVYASAYKGHTEILKYFLKQVIFGLKMSAVQLLTEDILIL